MTVKCYICCSYEVNRTINKLSDKLYEIKFRCLNPSCNNEWKERRLEKEDTKYDR